MIKQLSSVGLAIAVVTASMLAGCGLYFGSSSNGGGSSASGSASSGGPDGGASGSGASGSGTVGTGFSCTGDKQCAAGCFCQNGVCTEGGFCTTDKDCGPGFTCNTARSSCEPAAPPPPPPPPAALCAAPITCTTAAPACPDNQVALITNGCFTGACEAITACEAAPACTSLQHQDDCTARSADCAVVFTGHDCHGTTCGVSDVDCVCASYTFSSCESQAAPGPHVVVGP